MLDLNALARFACVVETGGFSAAARSLGVPRQSVHRSVSKLEERAGVRLLERSSRHVRPTEAGRRLFDHASAILRHAEEAATAIETARSEPQGVLRITASHLVAEVYLSRAIPVFLERWPKVQVDTFFTGAIADLVRDGIDVAFRAGGVLPPSMFAQRVGTTQMICCAAPGWSKRMEPGPYALSHVPLLIYGPAVTRLHFERGDDVISIDFRARLRSDSAPVARAAAVAGQGILRIPRMAVERELANGTLVEIFDGWKQPEGPIWALYASPSKLNPAVAAFVATVQETLQDPEEVYRITPVGSSSGM